MNKGTRVTAGRWFVGEKETDHQERGPDGCVWEAPSAEDVAREAAGGEPAEPFLVARVDHPPYARLIAAAPAMLEALELVLQTLRRRGGVSETAARHARAAVRAARGEVGRGQD